MLRGSLKIFVLRRPAIERSVGASPESGAVGGDREQEGGLVGIQRLQVGGSFADGGPLPFGEQV